MAMSAPATATGATNRTAGVRPRVVSSISAGIAATGAMFGRISTAIAATHPAATARHDTVPGPAVIETTIAKQNSHAAVAGMSLIGCVAEISDTGLVASQTADRMAAAGPETTSASRATAQIASASD